MLACFVGDNLKDMHSLTAAGAMEKKWGMMVLAEMISRFGKDGDSEYDLFLRLRGFDEGFRNGGEDVDLCFRARALGRTCHVALHSRILHHVSASPGRKLRDEENSRRLAHRWREEFLRLNRRLSGLHWCHTYLERHWEDPRDFDRRTVLSILLYRLGLRDIRHSDAAAHHTEAFQREINRWDHMLGPLPRMDFTSSLPAATAKS